MIQYNRVLCCYDEILVKVAAYLIPGQVCVCVCMCVVRSKQEPEVGLLLTKHKHTQPGITYAATFTKISS
jgi:hypothetical protein